MKRELVVDYSNFYTRNAILENFELIDLIVEEHDVPQTGSIYIGKVKKILKGKFAFIDIGHEKNTFLNLIDPQEQHLYDTKNNKKFLSIREEDKILVQIKKDGTDLKGALVTTNLSITGKYIVLFLNNTNISISNKITDTDFKNKLKQMVIDILPKGYGAIIRTNAKNAPKDLIQKEIHSLIEKSKLIFSSKEKLKFPSKIYSESSETEKIIRDYLSQDDFVYINSKTEYEKLKNNSDFKNIILYKDKLPIFQNFNIENQIEKAFHRKIWLKSGGFIIIDEVEAMNIIDVNSGKNIHKNYEKMVFKTNLEAIEESFKQIKLRNLSGMILIDLINTKDKDHAKILFEKFTQIASKDKSKISSISMTDLGLLQLTRKKTKKSLREVFTKSCPTCAGVGVVYNEQYIANIIKNQVLFIFSETNFNLVRIHSNRRVIDAFKEMLDIKKFNRNNKKLIETSIIQTAKFDYFEIEKLNNIY